VFGGVRLLRQHGPGLSLPSRGWNVRYFRLGSLASFRARNLGFARSTGGSLVVCSTLRRMRCPQCGEDTPDEDWNCRSCRMNVYWASRHHSALGGIRRQLGLPEATPTPSFLITAHAQAMAERADRGGREEHRVRQIARRVMAGSATEEME
jgi:predicted RNA-binding Zn-ribbon protein involved in translation (DUF1610 family)